MTKPKNPSDANSVKGELLREVAKPAAKELWKAAKEAGQIGGELVVLGARTARVLLAPIRGFVWGVERIEDWLATEVEARLSKVPEQKRQPPDPQVAVPAIQALTYMGDKSELSGLFSNLLVTSMSIDTASSAHPSFVEIIKQLSPDEAKLFKLICERGIWPFVEVRIEGLTEDNDGRFSLIGHRFPDVKAIDLAQPKNLLAYLNNLVRLGLVESPVDRWLADKDHYAELEAGDVDLGPYKRLNSNARSSFGRRGVWITEFGKMFRAACIN